MRSGDTEDYIFDDEEEVREGDMGSMVAAVVCVTLIGIAIVASALMILWRVLA